MPGYLHTVFFCSRQSVQVAMDELECYIRARIGSNHPAETTGTMIAVKFEHDSERDWHWVMSQLRQGESAENLIQKLEQSRHDKPNPGYNARLTVTRAYARHALTHNRTDT